jgi:hypothetical protein
MVGRIFEAHLFRPSKHPSAQSDAIDTQLAGWIFLGSEIFLPPTSAPS